MRNRIAYVLCKPTVNFEHHVKRNKVFCFDRNRYKKHHQFQVREQHAKGNQQTVRLLLQLRQEAIKDQEPRVAQRFHAMALSIEGRTTSEIAQVLKDAGYQGFLAFETDMPHPDYEEKEEKMIEESIGYLKKIAANLG